MAKYQPGFAPIVPGGRILRGNPADPKIYHPPGLARGDFRAEYDTERAWLDAENRNRAAEQAAKDKAYYEGRRGVQTRHAGRGQAVTTSLLGVFGRPRGAQRELLGVTASLLGLAGSAELRKRLLGE